jgi:FAD/FMN-containing dehydrogenase
LKYFSTDGSVFSLKPQVVVYPRNTSDVRKVNRFGWQLAERGHVVPITARGKGTDQTGAALGTGMMVVFPAHMNKILELDRETVTVQPGIIYSKLQQTLHTHGRFIPPYPSSIEFSTIGGAVANNASGENSVKYGSTRDFVKSLHVVLANGELIKTDRLTKRELNKKKGLTTFEGEIYRSLDAMISDNLDAINDSTIAVTKNSAGYALDEVKRKDGSFDLTPLFVGSQGTLGVVTQVVLKTAPHNPSTTLMAAFFDELDKAVRAINDIKEYKPSALEMVDDNLLEFIKKNHPNQLRGIINEPIPKIVLLVEFDDGSVRTQKRKMKQTRKVLQKYSYEFNITTDEHEKETLWKIRHSAAAVMSHESGNSKAVPIIEDGVVPLKHFQPYIKQVYKLFEKYNLEVALWGHGGDGNLHMQPFIDLSKVGDRQKVFKLADEYYDMVIKFGGSTSGEHNDGRMRGPYLPKLYGQKIYDLFKQTKQIFDPHNMLNPGVKIDVEQKDLVPILRREYSMEHLYDHLPRS